jgi:hypothetical protein
MADKEQRKRLAAIRAIAPLAVPPCQVSQPIDNKTTKGEKAGDENPPENLPQVSRASHYS